jgi:hypothetical protein
MSDGDVYSKLGSDEFVVMIPQTLIALISWFQLILSLNKFTSIRAFSTVDFYGLILFMLGGILRWIAALAVRNYSIEFQVCSAALGTLIKSTAFIIIFNCSFQLPTVQQFIALLLSVVITSLWEIQNRLVFGLGD